MKETSVFDIIADLDTPVSAFMKLRDLQPRFLLESVEGGERLARYSFLGFGAASTVRLENNHLYLDDKIIDEPTSQIEYLQSLRKLLRAAPKLTPSIDDLPFSGGLVGVSGYDIIRLFEDLPALTVPQENLPRAIFVMPTSVLVFDHLTRRAALLHAGSEVARKQLKQEVIKAGLIKENEYDKIMSPLKMTKPK